ncbi:hypothetical protein EOH33_21475 [Salmonella enterica]|uniref:Uncharacterized protein n=1 Tax=Salmonella enterica subsp. enterica serovar Poona TaxID=436295 RepID=A0A5V6NKB1_SALET|nr:hypothetical protein [Salmonella enterica]EBS4766007.1 hypothetical protein [Salmonella enterica subsp. enterica serovar Poona]EBV6878725.1 hypothetical protein [Salmonella enterica subsp. enterica serovar Pomona]ECC3860988.1 hypothetical protein [Salmonella enterica subsp. enterica]EAU9329434.1 hypothetical protein [Salmonella enterica]
MVLLSVLWLEWNCLQPTSKNNRYDRQCKSKYRDLRQTFLYPDSPSMATSVRYATHAGYTLFPTGYRSHKPEQNAGE